MNIYRTLILTLLLNFLLFNFNYQLFAQILIHDPSHMVKDSTRYYIFNTGNGIEVKSADSTDFANWHSEPDIFPTPGWPAWINNYAPNFGGNFWAPDIIFMNGKWHLYYSATSEFGKSISAMGLVTTPSLFNPAWEDQGMVVYSTSSSGFNTIDACAYRDNEGKVWLLFGSYWNGIYVTEIDTLTGKPFDRNNLHHVANGNIEAGFVISHGDYYYLFFNRGRCCAGINSTYHIVMGRSTSPTGPFYDRDSITTTSNGGSLFLHSDGRFLGPGHFGYGEDKLTYHYYDGLASGAARLKIADLTWEDDWPVAYYSRSGYLGDGNYEINNNYTNKVLQLLDADTASGTKVVQYTETGDTIQHWSVSYIGDGYYKISPVLAPDNALEVQEGSISNGANVQIGKYEGAEHQQWYLGNMGANVYRIVSRKSKKVLEIAAGSFADYANARQNSYNENYFYQRWKFKTPIIIESAISAEDNSMGLILYPNPSDGSFTIELKPEHTGEIVKIEIYRIDGKRIYYQSFENTGSILFPERLSGGIYMVKVISGERIWNQKIMVQ